MGVDTRAEVDAVAREEQAVQRITASLVERYAPEVPATQVESTVDTARRHFEGHPLREFVPILVERRVRRELAAKLSPPAAESVAAEHAVSLMPSSRPPANKPADASASGNTPSATESAAVDLWAAAPGGEAPANEPGVVDDPASGGAPGTAESVAVRHPAAAAPGNESAVGKSAAADLPASAVPGGGVRTSTSPTTHRAPTTRSFAELWAKVRSDKRILPLAGVAVAIVAVLIVVFALRDPGSESAPAVVGQAPTELVQGVVGSEKMPFFQDPKVIAALARGGFEVRVTAAGSREIATTVDLGPYDFAFPSSEQAAERILRARGGGAKYAPFSSPMAIATFGPIAELLTRAGVMRPGAVNTFDMDRYLELVQRNTEWAQLPENTAYPVRKNILISTTDPRTSNSAAMYLAIAAFVANDHAIVQGPDVEQRVLPVLAKLFVGQGYTENSSQGPFDQYLSAGMGPTPLALIYESQFVEASVQGRITPEMVLAYPSPTVLSKHTLVPLGERGDRLGKLLSTDPELQRLAAAHGYRTSDASAFAEVAATHRVPVARDLIDVTDTPTFDTLEHLLDGVGKTYN